MSPARSPEAKAATPKPKPSTASTPSPSAKKGKVWCPAALALLKFVHKIKGGNYYKCFKGYSTNSVFFMLQIVYMASASFFSFQHPLHKSLLRRRGRACQNLKRPPNSRKPNPRVWSRSHSTGSWMGSCLSLVASKTLSGES